MWISSFTTATLRVCAIPVLLPVPSYEVDHRRRVRHDQHLITDDGSNVSLLRTGRPDDNVAAPHWIPGEKEYC
ncbi:hypothetical protein F4678DRAFT_445815 [Xylaria arbuscula]|nr:hypothetical protein F4678DRAFT_445815 [Xylaria arbuscula]